MKNKIHGYIYKITNLINGKLYIGQTTRTIKERFKEHIKKSKKNIAIIRAIKKYSKENFKIEQIDIAYNQKELNLIEGVYMSWFKSLTTENGYNIKKVINGKGRHSEETKEKMRIKAKEQNRIEKSRNQGKKMRGFSNKNSSSKFCGVSIYCKKWKASHRLNNELIHLGTYLSEEDAAKARDIAEININPDAILNFPELREQYLKNEIIINKSCRQNYSYSKQKYIYFNKTRNIWVFYIKGFKFKRFKTKVEAENYAEEYNQIRKEQKCLES